MYIYVLNYEVFPALIAFDPISLFLVTALSPCWPINRSVYVFEITTTKKKRSRLHDDNAVIVGPHFDFLDCSHDLKKDPPSAQLLFWHATLGTDGTNHRICDCWIYLASPRDMPFCLCTAQKNPRRGSLTELFRPNMMASKLVFFSRRGELRSALLQYAASNCPSAVSRRFAHTSRSRKRLNKREICFIPT